MKIDLLRSCGILPVSYISLAIIVSFSMPKSSRALIISMTIPSGPLALFPFNLDSYNLVKSNELESRIGATFRTEVVMPRSVRRAWRLAPGNRIVASSRGYNEHIGPKSIGLLQSL